jgi:hypothetical protein
VELDALLTDRNALELVLGLEDDSAQGFSRVIDAAFSRDGQHLIVLNRHAPFVRVFRRDGSLRSMFLTEGDGPGESRFPYAVAPGEDDQILIMDHGLKLLTLDGALVAERRYLPVQPVEVLHGCDKDWFVYGPSPVTDRSSGPYAWIHQVWLRPPDIAQFEPIYKDSAAPLTIGFGAQQTLATSGSRFVLLHRYAAEPRLLEWSCANLRPETMPESTQLLRPERELPPLTLDLSWPRPSGIAVAADELLWLENVTLFPPGSTNPEEAQPETWFTLLTRDSIFRAGVPGHYSVRDTYEDEEIIFTRSDPFETVAVVAMVDLFQRLRYGVRSRRRS